MSFFLLHYEFEANAADGLQFHFWFILDGGANFLDEYIEASGGKIVLVFHAPKAAQYSLSAHHLVFVDGEQLQNLGLSGCEHFFCTVLLVLDGGVGGIQNQFT